MPENELESPESEADYGLSIPVSLAYYDHATSSWKTYGLLWEEDYPESSETWPATGMMRNGKLYQRPRLVPRISESDCLLWPTPTAGDSIRGATIYSGGNPSLLQAVREMWPTPTVCGLHNRKGLSKSSGDGLSTAAKAGEDTANTGSLNPEWVGWLMGFPLGYTNCEDSATPLSPKSPSGSAG